MTDAGDIVNGPWATRSKEYVWSKLCAVFPRGITPSDWDAAVEINQCFFVFEGKTAGTIIPTGQALFLKRSVTNMAPGRAVLVVGEHPPLDKVDVNKDLLHVRYGHNRRGEFVWADHVIAGPGCLWALAAMFVQDATALGHLEPESWQRRFEHDGRPFTEDVA